MIRKDYDLLYKELQVLKDNCTNISCSMRKLEDWTLIHDQTNLNFKGTRVYIPIDDHDLQYTQLLFISKGNQIVDYNVNTIKQLEGFNYDLNYFAFENYNIIIRLESYSYFFTDIANSLSFRVLPAYNLQTVELGIDGCANKFIIQLPNDAGKIKGISDIESFTGLHLQDNEYNYDFLLYVK